MAEMATRKVNAVGPPNAKLMFIGMAPGREEVVKGEPFVGPAGRILNNSLKQLGVKRESVFITNVHDTFLQPGTPLSSLSASTRNASIARLSSEIERVKPNCIVPLGDEVLEIVCGISGISKWRGSILESSLVKGMKCVPTVHPAWIIRGMWKWEPVFTHIDIKRAVEQSKFPQVKLPERNAITGPSLKTTLDYIEECRAAKIVSVDIETRGYTKTGTGAIACVGIGYKPSEALCIPFTRSGGNYWGLRDEIVVWQRLGSLLQDPEVQLVGQNLSFEWIYFWLHHIYPCNMHIDTMLLHHTLYPDFGGTEDVWGRRRSSDEPGHALAFINSQYTDTPYYKDDARIWSPTMGDYALWRYNCLDVMVTLECAQKMLLECQAEGLWDFYCRFHQRVFKHACRMEWFGVAIDAERRARASDEIDKEVKILQHMIDSVLGRSFNVNSPKQVGDLLYNEMGLEQRVHRKTRRVSADKSVLEYYVKKTDDDVLKWIMRLRSLLDLKGDIIDQKLGEDGRMHTHFKLGGTDSNRWSSTRSILGSGTNLQNIPREGIARCLFVPE